MSDNKAVYSIDYTKWSKVDAAIIAKNADKDNIKGLNTCKEILAFFFAAKNENVEVPDVKEIFGLKLSGKKPLQAKRAGMTAYNEMAKAFNSLDEYERGSVVNNANNKGYERLYTLERELNEAFENCEGYGLVNAHRDRFESRYAFDFEQVHNDVKTALNSLNKLQEEMEKAYDKAKGKTGSTPIFVDYDKRMKDLAQTKLGMSYENFVKKYDLDFTQGVTRAIALDPDFPQRDVYYKAKEYIDEIKRIARDELQNTRTEHGERLWSETEKYSNSVIKMVDFQYTDISASDIANMESEIMREAFIESINEATPVNNTKADNKNPDGKYYDKNKGSYYIVKNGIEYNLDGTKRQ